MTDIADVVARLREMIDPDDTQLRESLKVNGWLAELPSIVDEYGIVLVGNRRTRIAIDLGIEPVKRVVEFGHGDEADIARVRLATVSNIGGVAMTAKDRKRIAQHMYGLKWSQQAIADALGVSQRTISSDLFNLEVTAKLKPTVTASNPKGAGRPHGSGGKAKQTPAASNTARERARLEVRPYIEMGQPVPRAEIAERLGVSTDTVYQAMIKEEGRWEGITHGKTTVAKPVPAWRNAVGVSPPRELTGKPGPGSTVEEHNAFDDEYGRTPLFPKVVTDLNRAQRRVNSLTECVAGVEREDRPSVEAYFESIEAMLAYVPDKDQTDGREKDYATDARKALARIRKALPGALIKLHELEGRLKKQGTDKPAPLVSISA